MLKIIYIKNPRDKHIQSKKLQHEILRAHLYYHKPKKKYIKNKNIILRIKYS